MSFLFPHKSYKVYKGTFLDGVSLSLKFTPIEDGSENREVLFSYFKENFNLSLEDRGCDMPLLIKSNDANVKILFLKDSVRLSIGEPFYSSIADIKKLLPYAIGYLHCWGTETWEALSLLKSNTWSYDSQTEIPKVDLLREVFSVNLVNIDDATAATLDTLSTWGRENRFVDEDTGARISLTYSYRVDDDNSSKGVVNLKSLYTCDERFAIAELDAKLSVANNNLYDAFHWAVTDAVIDWMENGK